MWTFAILGLLGLLVMGTRNFRPPAPRSREEIERVLQRTAQDHPEIAKWFVWAQANKESNFNSSAGNFDGEHSIGLYQINWRAHKSRLLARGISRERLYDPWVNAEYWGELTKGLKAKVKAHGYHEENPLFWFYVRYRLAGIDWDDFDGEYAEGVRSRFQSYADRWQREFGA